MNGLYLSGSSLSTLVNCIEYYFVIDPSMLDIAFVLVAIDPYKKLERFVELKRDPSVPTVLRKSDGSP